MPLDTGVAAFIAAAAAVFCWGGALYLGGKSTLALQTNNFLHFFSTGCPGRSGESAKDLHGALFGRFGGDVPLATVTRYFPLRLSLRGCQRSPYPGKKRPGYSLGGRTLDSIRHKN